MLMLIPVALITTLTVMIVIMNVMDEVDAQASAIESARIAVTYHHELVLEREFPDEGVITPPGGGVFSAFGGIRSHIYKAGGTVYVTTFLADYDDDVDISTIPEERDRTMRSVMQKSTADTKIMQSSRGEVVGGDIEYITGPFPATIAGLLLPFIPPVAEGAPVMVTIATGFAP